MGPLPPLFSPAPLQQAEDDDETSSEEDDDDVPATKSKPASGRYNPADYAGLQVSKEVPPPCSGGKVKVVVVHGCKANIGNGNAEIVRAVGWVRREARGCGKALAI